MPLYQSTGRYISEDCSLISYHCKNLDSIVATNFQFLDKVGNLSVEILRNLPHVWASSACKSFNNREILFPYVHYCYVD
jgi:hypothetical protein